MQGFLEQRNMSEDHHIKLREYIERILEEREKALMHTAQALEKRLDYLKELHNDVVVKRVEAVERWQSRLIGIGITLVALSGLIGWLLGK